MTIFYFTSTGNSLATAKRIASQTAGEETKLVSVPQAMKAGEFCYKDSKIGFVFPIYAFAPPKIVRRFLKKLKIETNYSFVIGTHGDKYAGFGRLVKKIFKKRKLRLDYVNRLKTVDNALIGYETANQIATLPEKKVEEHLQGIITDISGNKSFILPSEKGQRFRGRVIRIISPVFENRRIGKMMISADEKCSLCGTCAKVCPAGNITVTDKVVIGKSCENCIGCVHNCPRNALHFKNEKSSARWRNPEVSLKEIIDSNNQTK